MAQQPAAIDLVPEIAGERVVRLDGPEQVRLDRYFAKIEEMERPVRDAIFSTGARILQRCPDPSLPRGHVTGLVLGKVQSGKTSQFISLIALALDNGYRTVIVIGGRDNALLAQNQERLDSYLGLRGRPEAVAHFVNPSFKDHEEMRAVLETKRPVIITVLKHQSRLSHLRELLSSPEIRGYPTLIIDDEGDQASPNTKVRLGKQSAVHRAILGVRAAVANHAYLAITATPQANLLMQTWDDLSPDFCVLVEPGPGYCGGATFFGEARSRLLRDVPDNEVEPGEGLPGSLKVALAVFLVGAAVRSLRGDSKCHSALIHTSNLRQVHAAFHRKTEILMSGWRDSLRLRDSDPAVGEVVALLGRAHTDVASTVTQCPSFDDVLRQVREEILNLKVWMVNSLDAGSNPNAVPLRLKNNVFIGGNMLDRGVTLKGLAATYITRSSGTVQADTLEQRARWFGYKAKYLDVCRVYGTRQLLDYLYELSRHEEDFWASLRRSESQGIPLKEWPRLMRLGLEMLPTRPAVAEVRTFKGQGWLAETRPEHVPALCNANIAAVNSCSLSHSLAGR